MKNDAERGSLMKSDTDIPCVQLSTEQQVAAIEAACKAANLDAHITRITAKSRAATWAEKLAVRFKLDREDLVVKNSYMYCDALDMCFFFLNGRTPPSLMPVIPWYGRRMQTADWSRLLPRQTRCCGIWQSIRKRRRLHSEL